MGNLIKKIVLIFLIINAIFITIFNTSYASTVNEVMESGENFIDTGKQDYKVNEEVLHETSNFLYNLLLGIGIIVAVIVGSILGLKYMIGSVEEKAEMKEKLLAYIISCGVVFGAFGIWKIAVNILSVL